MVKTCYNKSGADRKELIEFEMSDDWEHLPNSHALKLFLRCQAELVQGVEPKSNKILLSKFTDFFSELTHEQQELYLRMGRGCVKRVRGINDRLEFIYLLTVCIKQNDNEVNSCVACNVFRSPIFFFAAFLSILLTPDFSFKKMSFAWFLLYATLI